MRLNNMIQTGTLLIILLGIVLFSPVAYTGAVDFDLLAEMDRLREATGSKQTFHDIAPGVQRNHWHIVASADQPGPWNINVIRVSLDEPGVSVRVVEAENGSETVSSICRRVGAVAAVNGGFFGPEGPQGLVVVDGVVRSPMLSWKPPRAALGLSGNRAWIDIVEQRGINLIPAHTTDWFDWSQAQYVLGAGPLIVFQSKIDMNTIFSGITEGFEEHSSQAANQYIARTAVGIRQNRIYLMTVDGPIPDISIGMTLEHVAGYLLSRCLAPYAMALDGGASTTMVSHGRVVNFPLTQDDYGRAGVEIPVANALCVFYGGDTP